MKDTKRTGAGYHKSVSLRFRGFVAIYFGFRVNVGCLALRGQKAGSVFARRATRRTAAGCRKAGQNLVPSGISLPHFSQVIPSPFVCAILELAISQSTSVRNVLTQGPLCRPCRRHPFE
jgi:hypothetical protein